jgi:hypothetical protein
VKNLSLLSLSVYYSNEIKLGFSGNGDYRLKSEFSDLTIEKSHISLREQYTIEEIIQTWRDNFPDPSSGTSGTSGTSSDSSTKSNEESSPTPIEQSSPNPIEQSSPNSPSKTSSSSSSSTHTLEVPKSKSNDTFM